VNLKKLLLAAMAAVMAVMVGLRYWPGDERAIRKQIAKIEALGSKTGDEKPIDSLLRARQLSALFHDPSTLQVESADFSGEYSRKQIQDRIIMVRSFYSKATVSIHDLNINLLDNDQATVLCTLRVKGEGNARPVADVQELEAGLRKIEGNWLFNKVTLVEVLER